MFLVARDRLQLDYKDNEISIGYRAIPNDATRKTLEALGPTFNFIYKWIKLLRENYEARCETYINAMKEMFMQIPQMLKYNLLLNKKSKNS